jgi:transposase
MISYEQFCKIKDYHQNRHLHIPQIARELGLQVRTVAKWLGRDKYVQRKPAPRASRLDAFKPQIVRWLETHPYSATQIYLRLRDELNYKGGVTVVRDYVCKVRPRRAPAFLTLAFAPGECAQVDWGQWGTVVVGNTTRRLSFFVMVLCYSRKMFVEFTVSETMEHFLACHQHAFEFFGAVPSKIMVDNLKSAVLRRVLGQAPVFNPRYQDFADHYGFKIVACGVAKGNEKGRVENAVGYIKKNFLAGQVFTNFCQVNPAARIWLDTIANVRQHGTTKQQPAELFQKEKPALRPLSLLPYDIGVVHTIRATSRFRVTHDTNTYSIPAEYASARLTLKVHPDHLCIYNQDKLIARHVRSYDRHQDFENPDHPRELLQQRRKAQDQKVVMRLLALSPKAETFYRELQQRRLNVIQHARKIVALSEIYGAERTARAIEDAVEFHAFSCEYIANLLEQRQRLLPEPGALHLTRREDLLDLELPEPNLNLYETDRSNHLLISEREKHEPEQGTPEDR